ncbi:MAG: rRNA pseudouridine synthase [Lachnospiraceae bacterium]|nr:rRNA pseudouridine synthase [Lachnospiraceae bacterium]
MIRLDKYISLAAAKTRSEAKALIKKKQVTCDGAVVNNPDMKIDENSSVITLMGKELSYKEFVYYMLNKPEGFVTATTDLKDSTVMDLVKGAIHFDKLFPVGRLDKDSTGLLLITDDGETAHRLLSPSKHVFKKYFITLDNDISDEQLNILENGVMLDGEMTKPAHTKRVDSSSVYISICEGKFHQVKRMVHCVGLTVTSLKRVSFGPLILDDNLKPGEFRELTPEEIKSIKEVTK